MNHYTLPIGDWSDDGHGRVEKFTVKTEASLNQLREAHFAIKNKLNFDIHSIANEFEEGWLEPQHVEEIEKLGLSPNKYCDVENGNLITTSEKMFLLWMDLLNLADENLQLESIEKPESIVFYGKDGNGRHISQVGYGTFDI